MALVRARGKTAWQGNGLLTVGSTTEAIQFQADFPRSGYYTVQFDVQPQADMSGSQIIFPRAEILWAVEGTFVRRLISLSRGNVISGAGQGIAVRMFDYSVNTDPVAGHYAVSAQVTRGTRPNGASSKPPILIAGPTAADPRGESGSISMAVNATRFFVMPPNSGINSFYVSAVDETAGAPTAYTNNNIWKLWQLPASGTVIPTDVVWSGNYDQFGQWIPLSPAARIVAIQNMVGNVDSRVTLMWGVEG